MVIKLDKSMEQWPGMHLRFEKRNDSLSREWMTSIFVAENEKPYPVHRVLFRPASAFFIYAIKMLSHLREFVDIEEKQIIIHKVKCLRDIGSLRKFKSSGKFELLQKYFVSYGSLVDFGNVALFNNLLLPLKSYAGVSPGLRDNFSMDAQTDLSVFFEPGDGVSLEAKKIHDFIKDSYTFDKLYRPQICLSELSIRNLAILITEPKVPTRILENSSLILKNPSLLMEK